MIANNYELISKCDGRVSTDRIAHLNNGSIVLKVAAVGVLILAFITKLWLLIVAVLMYAGGIVLKQTVLQQPMQYVYSFNDCRFRVSVITVFGKETQLLNIDTTDIIGIGDGSLPHTSEIVATDKPAPTLLYFVENGATTELRFTPDEYMTAILRNEIGE